MDIRAARPEDAEAIEAVRVAGWKAGYRGVIDDAFLDGLQPDVGYRRRGIEMPAPVTNLIAIDSDGAAGWICGGPDADGSFEIFACYVDPNRWRAGVGRRLMSELLSQIEGSWPAVAVWTMRETPRSIRFYKACGFELDGEQRSSPLGGGELDVTFDEVRLTRQL